MNEDVAADAELVQYELAKGGLVFNFKRVHTRKAFEHEIKQHPPDVILSDHGLPSFDGFTAVAVARKLCPDVPFIFVTGASGEEITIEAFERGVTDYVLKDKLSRLVPVVQRALKATKNKRGRPHAETDRDQLTPERHENPGKGTMPGSPLPICSNCKRIRTDEDQWKQFEAFLYEHFDLMFTHGFCPDCFARLQSEFERPHQQ